MSSRPPDTRNDLIEVALHCFAEHGYDGTSLRLIAQRANRPLSLIGHHFGSKEGLYREVFRSLALSIFTVLAGGEVVPPRNEEEAVRLFREQIRVLYYESCPEDPALGDRKKVGRKLFLLEMRNPRPDILELLKTQLQPWVDRMKGCIKVLRPDLTEAEITLLGISIMGQVTSQSLLEGVSSAIWGRHGLGVSRSAELLADFSLQGLGVRLHPSAARHQEPPPSAL